MVGRREIVAGRVGLISWNEFSENSHVEPSRRYGNRYLKIVADITGAQGARRRRVRLGRPAGGYLAVSYGAPADRGGLVLLLLGVGARPTPDEPTRRRGNVGMIRRSRDRRPARRRWRCPAPPRRAQCTDERDGVDLPHAAGRS